MKEEGKELLLVAFFTVIVSGLFYLFLRYCAMGW